jgi:hypothetical protein
VAIVFFAPAAIAQPVAANASPPLICDTATVHIMDSSLSQVRTHNRSQFLLERSYVTSDVVASDDSVIVLSDTGIGGRIVRENGRVILNGVRTASRGFVRRYQGGITTKAGEVISGTASIKGSSSGATLYNRFIQTDRNVVPLTRGHTYRRTFTP